MSNAPPTRRSRRRHSHQSTNDLSAAVAIDIGPTASTTDEMNIHSADPAGQAIYDDTGGAGLVAIT